MTITYFFVESLARHDELASWLGESGLRTAPLRTSSEAESVLRSGDAAAVVLVTGPGGWSGQISAVCRAAARGGVPSLAIAEPSTDPRKLAEADDWAIPGVSPRELAARLARLGASRIRRERPGPSILSVIVHDLRTPLHVMSLALGAIRHALPVENLDLDEELQILEESPRRIERLLAEISEFDRLSSHRSANNPERFRPRDLVESLLKFGPGRPWPGHGPVSLVVEDSCPEFVKLDLTRTRLAIHFALLNVASAAGDRPVRLTLRGEPGRFLIELADDRPPPPSVRPTELRSHDVQRLLGVPGERRGLDLAIAAKVSEDFGGTARLLVDRAAGTVIQLDWPIAPGVD